MASGAADGLFRSIYEGCISGDPGRPYQRNCKCGLRNGSRKNCTHGLENRKVKYPMRRSWSEGSLALTAVGSSGHPSPSSPQQFVAGTARLSQLGFLYNEEEEDKDQVFFKV